MKTSEILMLSTSVILACLSVLLAFLTIKLYKLTSQSQKRLNEILTELHASAILASTDLEKLSEILASYANFQDFTQKAAKTSYKVLSSPVFKLIATGHSLSAVAKRLKESK